jgi:Zn ribbon nucleic-acid-binding protein
MAQPDATPKSGDVRTCPECGHSSAVYNRVPNNLFASPAEAAHPGRLPDIYAWTCTRCGHEEREAPIQERHAGR